MATIQELLNQATEIRDAELDQENTALRVGTMLVNIVQYLNTLITSEDADDAISDALDDFFANGALKDSVLPPTFINSLNEWSETVAIKEASTQLLKLIHSRIILLDSMGSTLDGLDYTPVAGDLVWRTGYVWKYNGSEYESGGLPPKLHVVYVNKHTGKPYMWNGSAMVEIGNHYDEMIQISKMDQTDVANIPVGKLHYIPSQAKLVYRISNSKTHSWTPRTDLVYIDVSNNTLYRWQGNSFQKVSSDIRVVNDLITGGGEIALSAEMGVLIKQNVDAVQANIERLYNKLGNIAFWNAKDQEDAEPTPLDWSIPKHTVTLALSLTNAVVKHNGVVKSNGDIIRVDEGATLTLIVEPSSGCSLSSVTSSTTGATVTDLGNGTYSVAITMGNSDKTLSVNATAAFIIDYVLIGCGAPSGITNPTTIADGSSATISLEADTGYTMPDSLPAGAVTGATAEYARDAQDDTRATIALSNPTGKVTINISAVNHSYESMLMLNEVITIQPNDGYYYASQFGPRACLLMNRSDTNNPCTWSVANKPSDSSHRNDTNLTTIPIPNGATKVSLECDSAYYYGLTLLDENGVPQNTVEWTIGSTKKELNFVDYPNATHIAVNFKIGSGGTSNFSNQTYESMGIDFQII